jgi:hypothetical protein
MDVHSIEFGGDLIYFFVHKVPTTKFTATCSLILEVVKCYLHFMSLFYACGKDQGKINIGMFRIYNKVQPG